MHMRLTLARRAGVTTWHCEGRTGAGLAEYLDQIADGRPAGTAVGF